MAINYSKNSYFINLINYKSFEVERGNLIRENYDYLIKLFGGLENIIKIKNSIVIGISQVPYDKLTTQEHLKRFLNVYFKTTVPVEFWENFSDRICILDPMEKHPNSLERKKVFKMFESSCNNESKFYNVRNLLHAKD